MLQIATRLGSFKKFKEYTDSIDFKQEPIFLRNMIQYKSDRKPIDISIEPASEITKRFVTGAMSFGSISRSSRSYCNCYEYYWR